MKKRHAPAADESATRGSPPPLAPGPRLACPPKGIFFTNRNTQTMLRELQRR